MNRVVLMAVIAVAGIPSCAPRYSAAEQRPVASLSCTELRDEYAKLLSIRREAESKSGLSGQNVAWAILFWPGAVVNEMDNREVMRKVDERAVEIASWSANKGCPVR